MGEVTRVEEKGRGWLQPIDLGGGQLQRGHHIWIRLSLEADMRVTDLDEAEIPSHGLLSPKHPGCRLPEDG
jgi:hypothetical protein